MNGPWEDYGKPWEDFAPAKEQAQETTAQKTKNELGGMARGAASIGSLLVELGNTGGTYGKPLGTLIERYKSRTGDVESALQSLGTDTNSGRYAALKTGTEVAGSLGAGPAVAAGAKAVPMLARFAPAIESAGMKGANWLERVLGGGVSGFATAGIVDPEQALTGAKIGAAAPPILKAAGEVGKVAGKLVSGPAQAPEAAAAIKAAREAGYVIPPTQAKPTLGNRLLEGISGKISTAQNASARNQAVTSRIVAEDLGLPTETVITPEVLKTVRQQAGQAYEAVRGAGVISADNAFQSAVGNLATKYRTTVPSFPGLGKTNMHGQPVDEIADLVGALKARQFDASEAVDAIGILRERADKAFSVGDKTLGKANREAAGALEDLLGRHLATNGTPDILAGFRQARQTIAKTYSVEKALNPATGNVDAKKLAGEIKRGKPLTGGLKQAGDFAARFPKAAQTVEGMGSLPQTSPLDWATGAALSAGLSSPIGLIGVAARPAARAAVLSAPVQNRLIQSNDRLFESLLSPDIQTAIARPLPSLLSSR